MEGKKGERQRELESPEHLGEEGGAAGAGRSGGRMARDIGSKDELKRATERPAGVTRVRKSDEKETRPQLKTGRQ
jgi:hypothetical protein